MSKGVKKVLGVVAAIAIPFVAPAIAGAIGVSSTIGTSLVGASLGAGTAALTGGDPLLGAVFGGLSTYGAASRAAALPGQTSTGGSIFGRPGMTVGDPNALAGLSGTQLLPTATELAGTGTRVTSALGGAAAAATAPTSLGGFFQQVGQGLLNNPAGMAQLAATVYGRPPQNLTAAELANLEELKGLAETNRELFEQRVRGANEMIQMAKQQAPNPEQAFAETKIATERQLAEQTRGLGRGEAALAQRRTAIRGTQTGATAAAAEEERGRRTQAGLLQQGYGMLPEAAPRGYAGLALPTYEALQGRRDAYTRDLARATGDLFGGIA